MSTIRHPDPSSRWLAVAVIAAVAAACSGAVPSASIVASPPATALPSAPDSSGPPSASAAPTSAPDSTVVDVPAADGALDAIWIGEESVVAVGFVGPVFTSTIVVFDDGAWSTADVPETPGQVTGITEFAGHLIAIGNGLPDVQDSFIWSSADGHAWELTQTIDDAALHDIAAGDGVVVAVGASLDAEMNSTAMVWTSTDGTTWVPGDLADGDKTTMGSVAATSGGFAAIGDRALGAPRPFWTSATGSSWSAVENDLGDQLLPIDLVLDADGYAIAGATGRSGDQHPFVARSVDGERWERTDLAVAEGYASAASITADGIAVGGVDSDALTIWSVRGADVHIDVLEASGAAISAMAWDPDLGLVAVGARDGKHAIWRLEGR